MSSKKPAGSKRAAPPRTCDFTRAFLKDWERLGRSGRYDLRRLKEAMLLIIANDAPLGREQRRFRARRNAFRSVRGMNRCPLTLYAKAKTDNLTGPKFTEIRRVLEE